MVPVGVARHGVLGVHGVTAHGVLAHGVAGALAPGRLFMERLG